MVWEIRRNMILRIRTKQSLKKFLEAVNVVNPIYYWMRSLDLYNVFIHYHVFNAKKINVTCVNKSISGVTSHLHTLAHNRHFALLTVSRIVVHSSILCKLRRSSCVQMHESWALNFARKCRSYYEFHLQLYRWSH